MMNKRALGLALATVYAVEFAPVIASIAQPSDCACNQPRIASVPANFPEPEGRPQIASMLPLEQASAVTEDRRGIITWAELEVPNA